MAAKPSSPREKGGGVLPGSPEDGPSQPFAQQKPLSTQIRPSSARLTLCAAGQLCQGQVCELLAGTS